jgi:branched-chain amino acid aminotransferase
MEEQQAYFNGRFIPASEAMVSPADAGFVLGATVAEQLRTFRGEVFRLEAHLERLRRSLRMAEIDPGIGLGELAAIARDLVARNHRLLEPGDDLGLSIFITPGVYPVHLGLGEPPRPTVCLHTCPLPFALWADKYRTGQSLVVSDVRQVPSSSWPAALKCRSRMHYYLADRHAARTEPGARALLLDQEGFVSEATTANVLVYRAGEGLVSPPLARILHGISMDVALELAAGLGIPATQRNLTVEDLAGADEAFLTSTPLCLLPVTRLNGRAIGSGIPGAVYGRLLRAWSERVELDIVAQAVRFAPRV